MAIIIETNDPNGLLKSIKDAIAGGKLSGWEMYVHDKVEFITQSAGQYKKKAYLKPVVAANENRLKMGFYGDGKAVKKAVHSEYHAKFIQMLLDNFGTKFNWASAGVKPLTIDKFTLEN